jgi:2-oxoisovalerate dehydrogenase E2 component (dihydrolipoyl transacylase)
MPDFRLPDLGEGLEEADLIAWRVQVGDSVAVDQIVAEVETAKATVEIPIPFSGLVTELHAEPGATVPVGAPLVSVSDVAAVSEPDSLSATKDEVSGSSGNVLVGYGTGTGTAQPDTPTAAKLRGLSAPRRRPHVTGLVNDIAVNQPASRQQPVPVISPLVRKLARDGGLDVTLLAGPGSDGVVRRSDVMRALAANERDAAHGVISPGLSPARAAALSTGEPGLRHLPLPAGSRELPRPETRILLRGARKHAADKLTRSRREIPEATVWVDVDASALLAARSALNARTGKTAISLLAFIARFAILALREFPALNARIDGDEIVVPSHVHLGFAAQTERGLVVPVIRDAHLLSMRELSAELKHRTADARAGTLVPADMTGGTITVNNYGVFGVDGSAAIINYPEVAILGLGRIMDRPWASQGEVTVRKVTELTLAFDHRACDGGTAAGYLRYIANYIESPLLAIADL